MLAHHFKNKLSVVLVGAAIVSHAALAADLKTNNSWSLKKLYALIENKNPELIRTFFEQQATEQLYQSAKSQLLPQVAGSYAVGYNRSTLPGLAYRNARGNQQSLYARQLIFDGQKTWHNILGAKGDYQVSKATTRQLLNTLGYELAQAYLGAIRLNRLVRLSINNVAIHERTHRQMMARFDSGAAAKSEVTLSRARLAAARARLYAYQGEQRNNKYFLEKLVGMPVNISGKQAIPTKLLPKSFKQALDTAFEHNWDVVIAKHRLKAADERVKEQKSRYFWPTVSLQVSGNSSRNYSTLRGLSRDLQGSLVVDYTFFEGGNYNAEYNKAIKLHSAAKADLQQSLRLTRELIKTEWNDLHISRKRIKALSNHVYAIGQTLRLFKKEFELGKRSLLNVLDSTNELYNSRTNLEDARYNLGLDTFAIFSALGQLPDIYHDKGW